MQATWRKLAFGISLLLLSTGWGTAGEGETFQPSALTAPPDYDHILAGQPPGLKLTLTLPKDHFHQGEVINATLTDANAGSDPRVVTSNFWL